MRRAIETLVRRDDRMENFPIVRSRERPGKTLGETIRKDIWFITKHNNFV